MLQRILTSLGANRAEKETVRAAEEFLQTKPSKFSILTNKEIKEDILFSFVKIRGVEKDNRLVTLQVSAQLVERMRNGTWQPILSSYECTLKFATYDIDKLDTTIATLNRWNRTDTVLSLYASSDSQEFIFKNAKLNERIILEV